MFRIRYRMIALVLVLAVVIGFAAAMAPQNVQACDGCGTGSARYEPNELPDPVVRDFDGGCVWWWYELRCGRYVRVYCPCQYGNTTISTKIDHRGIYARSVAGQGGSSQTVSK